MSTNFKIHSHTNTDILFLNLSGDFDGNSAWELVNKIMIEDRGTGSIFIDTDKVRKIEPFGKITLETLIGIKRLYQERVIFTGKNGPDIGWEGCKLLQNGKKEDCVCDGNCKSCKCAAEQEKK